MDDRKTAEKRASETAREGAAIRRVHPKPLRVFGNASSRSSQLPRPTLTPSSNTLGTRYRLNLCQSWLSYRPRIPGASSR